MQNYSSATSTIDLPDLPLWTLHALGGALSFLLITTVILLLAQFPPSYSFPFPVRSKTSGYRNVRHADNDYSGDEDVGLRRTPGNEEAPLDKGTRKRKMKQLSIDTTVEYYGLGIAVAGGRQTSQVDTPEDLETLPTRLESKGKTRASQTCSAPLPSSRLFRIGTPRNSAATDIENSPSTLNSTSPGDHSPNIVKAPRRTQVLLAKLNIGIGRIADKLSKTFHDHVTEPEQGLLLPVRSKERERPLVLGEFVD